MIYTLALVALAVLVVGALDRVRGEDAHRELLADISAAHERERIEWVRERQLLLNRIKPETAQYVPTPGEPILSPSPPSVPPDDDEAYWAAREGVSKEDLAAALERHELGR